MTRRSNGPIVNHISSCKEIEPQRSPNGAYFLENLHLQSRSSTTQWKIQYVYIAIEMHYVYIVIEIHYVNIVIEIHYDYIVIEIHLFWIMLWLHYVWYNQVSMKNGGFPASQINHPEDHFFVAVAV